MKNMFIYFHFFFLSSSSLFSLSSSFFFSSSSKIIETYSNAYSKWNYVRYTYSYDLQKYYLNNIENNLQKEIFFSNPSNKINEKGF